MILGSRHADGEDSVSGIDEGRHMRAASHVSTTERKPVHVSLKSRLTILASATVAVAAAATATFLAIHVVADAKNSHATTSGQVYSINPNMYSTASATDATGGDNRAQGM